jgi:hypothetical protein
MGRYAGEDYDESYYREKRDGERIAELGRKVADRDREIKVLTQERDNALLRIEELESAFGITSQFTARGGVHPNA